MTTEEQQTIEQHNKALLQISREQHGHRAYAQARFELGKNYYQLGDIEKAILVLQSIQARDYPELYAHAQFNIGNYYSELGHPEKAIQMWQHIQPSHGELYVHTQLSLGNAHYQLNNIEKALETWQHIKYKDGKDLYINAIDSIANTYVHLDQIEMAIELWKSLIGQYDEDVTATAYFNLGNLYDDLKQFEYAIHAWNHVPVEHSLYASTQFNIGNAYLNLNQKEYAIHAWQNIPSQQDEIYNYAQQKIMQLQQTQQEINKNTIKEHQISQNDTEQQLQLSHESITENQEIYVEKQIKNEDVTYTSTKKQETEVESLQQAHLQLQQHISTILRDLRINDNDFEQQIFLNLATQSIVDELKQPHFKLRPIQEQQNLIQNSVLLDFLAFNHLHSSSQLLNHHRFIFIKPFSFNINRHKLDYKSNDNLIYIGLHAPLLQQIAEKNSNQLNIQLYRCIYIDPTTDYIELSQRDKWSFYQEWAKYKTRNEIEEYYQQYQNELMVKRQKIYQALHQLKQNMQQIYSSYPHQDTLNTLAVQISPLLSLVQHPNTSAQQECHLCCFSTWDNPHIQTDAQSTAICVQSPTRLTASLREVYLPQNSQEIYPFMLQLFEGQTHRIQHLSYN